MSVVEDLQPTGAGRGFWKRLLLAALVIVLATAAATATAGLREVDTLTDLLVPEGSEIPGGDLDPGEVGGPRTILLIGSDKRALSRTESGLPARSDTLILVRLNPEGEFFSVMSLPRDLLVTIPRHRGRGPIRDKINRAYQEGGPGLTVRTVKNHLTQALGEPFRINHVVNVNFGGFQRAVNYIDCVYTDIDRRYFNDNSGGGELYATIDIQAGYQRLCGQDSLDYVRYRHEDNDIVRGARQQEFLRQAKQQVGLRELFDDREQLARLFGRYTEADRGLRDEGEVIDLIKAAIVATRNPIREVRFPGILGEVYVKTRRSTLRRALREFLEGRSSSGPRGRLRPEADDRALRERSRRRRSSRGGGRSGGLGPGLEYATRAGEDLALSVFGRIRFPLYFPRVRTKGALYPVDDNPRVYSIEAPDGKRYRAYRIVVRKGIVGEYYGIQGINGWTDPPILQGAHDTVRAGGRSFDVYRDGDRIRLIAWRRGDAVYWLSNTLLQSLSNKQMLAIARSTKAFG